MGKQVNYAMDYEAFLQLAQFALDLGCMIIRNDHTQKPSYPSAEISAVIPECQTYLFYLPELYPMDQIEHGKDYGGKYYLANTFSGPFSIAIIEAGFSIGESGRARVYVTTGFYDKDGNWIARPERLTKIYDRIARKARKLAKRIL